MPISNTVLKPVGLFGGTFDPIHNGHLALAKGVLNALACAEIRFIPCRQNVLKTNAPVASGQQRLDMLNLALAHEPKLLIDMYELQQPQPSYTIDTIRALKQAISNPLYLIIASDNLTSFEQWQQWPDLLKLSKLVVGIRPGQPLAKRDIKNTAIRQLITDSIPTFEQKKSSILLLPLPNQVNISATQIRNGIRQQQDMSSFVPPAVWHYIQQHKLYQQRHD